MATFSKTSYPEYYLDSAQDILGHAFDWVVNTCGADLTEFATMFAKSNVGIQFGLGNPKYVAGVNGSELANTVMYELGLPEFNFESSFYADKSEEYWIGWALALYQWQSDKTFEDILNHISIKEFQEMYLLGHELGEEKLIEILDSKYNRKEN